MICFNALQSKSGDLGFLLHAIVAVESWQILEERYQQLLLDRWQRMVCFKHLQLGKEAATLIFNC